MADPRILLLQCPPEHGEELPESLRNHFPDLTADFARVLTQALDKVKSNGYQAIVCWADEPDELAAIIRIRKSDSSVPVFVVSQKSDDEEFGSLARQAGATSVHPDMDNADLLADLLAVALRATRQAKDQAQRARILSKGVRKLGREPTELADQAMQHLKAGSLVRFSPLIILDEKNGIDLFRKALTRAKLSCPLPILRKGDDAIAYFDGRPPYGDRKRYPLPSIAILNGGPSNLKVLSWIRSEPRFKALPVAFLSRVGGEVAKAASLGATWCSPKGSTSTDLAETLKKISLNWTVYNLGLDV